LLSSYLPCPQELRDTESGSVNIGYDVFFNPDSAIFMKVLEYTWVREQGIETREPLMESVKNSQPGCYENGLKINNNLFKFGFRNWYDWCNANWGTKWDTVGTILIDQSPTDLIFIV